jgi:hypothetical protein
MAEWLPRLLLSRNAFGRRSSVVAAISAGSGRGVGPRATDTWTAMAEDFGRTGSHTSCSSARSPTAFSFITPVRTGSASTPLTSSAWPRASTAADIPDLRRTVATTQSRAGRRMAAPSGAGSGSRRRSSSRRRGCSHRPPARGSCSPAPASGTGSHHASSGSAASPSPASGSARATCGARSRSPGSKSGAPKRPEPASCAEGRSLPAFGSAPATVRCVVGGQPTRPAGAPAREPREVPGRERGA